VKSVSVSNFIGHKPNKARVQVEYNAAGKKAGLPASLFVKGGFKGVNNETVSGIDAGLDIGTEVELLAYHGLVSHLEVNTPQVFAVMFDQKSYSGIVVMEDLALANVTFLKSSPGLSYVQAAAFVDALARIHAPWMNSPQFAAGGQFGPSSSLAECSARLKDGYINHMATTPRWADYVALPRGAAMPCMFQDAARVAAAQKKMNELHQACARTIVHGDEHLGNLYLDAKGNPGFIDWCARIEPWAISVSYFLVVTIDTMDRRQWERPLLHLYLERLARYGATVPNFEEAWLMYRCTTLYPFLVWFINSAKWQPEAVNTRNTVRGALAMMDHDTFDLLGV
jgi:Phosphotransferase enzyme family